MAATTISAAACKRSITAGSPQQEDVVRGKQVPSLVCCPAQGQELKLLLAVPAG